MSTVQLFNEMFVPEIKRCNIFTDVKEVCDWTVTRKNQSYSNGMKTVKLHHTSARFILTFQPLNIFKYYGLHVCLWLHNSIYLLPHPCGRCFDSRLGTLNDTNVEVVQRRVFYCGNGVH